MSESDAFSATTKFGQSADNSPLSGIRVLDLTQFESGPTCTHLLGLFGAEVIKIERPGTGEQGRNSSADIVGLDSFYFLVLNGNKRSVTLDLKAPEGRAIFLDLVKISDVVVHNLAPGAADRLGIGADDVTSANPHAILAEITGFGKGTVYESLRSFDPIAQAAGGSMSLTGLADGPPLRPGPTFADWGSGLLAVIGIMMALFDRMRTGACRRVDVALQDAIISACRVAFGIHAMTGEPGRRMGNQIQFPSSPAAAYPCAGGGADDYCYIYVGRGDTGDHNWVKLLEIMERSELLDDDRFATNGARVANQEIVDEIVGSWTSRFTKHQVVAALGAKGVPAGPVLNTGDLIEDESLRRRGSLTEVTHPVRGKYVVPGVPIKLSGSDPQVLPAPVLGEANDYVLGSLLGLDEAARDRLRATGVI
jgi:formyl-CoA transferase